jgi:hypothetical protein
MCTKENISRRDDNLVFLLTICHTNVPCHHTTDYLEENISFSKCLFFFMSFYKNICARVFDIMISLSIHNENQSEEIHRNSQLFFSQISIFSSLYHTVILKSFDQISSLIETNQSNRFSLIKLIQKSNKNLFFFLDK